MAKRQGPNNRAGNSGVIGGQKAVQRDIREQVEKSTLRGELTQSQKEGLKTSRGQREADKKNTNPKITRRQRSTSRFPQGNKSRALTTSSADDFTAGQRLLLQLSTNPNSDIIISNAQAKYLANMSDDEFKTLVHKYIPSDTLHYPFINTTEENIVKLTSARRKVLDGWASDPTFINARQLKESQANAASNLQAKITTNLQDSQTDIQSIKGAGEPLDWMTKDVTPREDAISRGILQPGPEEFITKDIKPRDLALKQPLSPEQIEALESIKTVLPGDPVAPTVTNKIRNPATKKIIENPAAKKRIENAAATRRLDYFKEAHQARLTSQNVPIEKAQPLTPPGKISSRTANLIADDTMRAASIIHSSKLGFAAIGVGAIGAVFGMQSLRNKNRQESSVR